MGSGGPQGQCRGGDSLCGVEDSWKGGMELHMGRLGRDKGHLRAGQGGGIERGRMELRASLHQPLRSSVIEWTCPGQRSKEPKRTSEFLLG